jgi:hypothetical protein
MYPLQIFMSKSMNFVLNFVFGFKFELTMNYELP